MKDDATCTNNPPPSPPLLVTDSLWPMHAPLNADRIINTMASKPQLAGSVGQ